MPDEEIQEYACNLTNDQKDAVCQLWIEIFGTKEGAGYNCPAGAYQFAEVVMSYEREACITDIKARGNK